MRSRKGVYDRLRDQKGAAMRIGLTCTGVLVAAVISGTFPAAAPVAAAPLAAAPVAAACDRKVILTVSVPGQKDLSFGLEDLRRLGATEVRTSTIWTRGLQDFRGVPLRTLIGDRCAGNCQLRATAVNDYSVTIPMAEITSQQAIVAYENNGTPMSLRDKGPLWIVYPYDSSRNFRTEIIYGRSIWQLDRIEVIR